MKKNKYKKDIRLIITDSENKKLELMKNKARKELELSVPRNSLIRLALNEFSEKVKSMNELKELLKKYYQI